MERCRKIQVKSVISIISQSESLNGYEKRNGYARLFIIILFVTIAQQKGFLRNFLHNFKYSTHSQPRKQLHHNFPSDFECSFSCRWIFSHFLERLLYRKTYLSIYAKLFKKICIKRVSRGYNINKIC